MKCTLKFWIALFISAAANLHAQDTTRLSLLFVGDIMQHDSQIADAYNPSTRSYDYTSCFQYIKPYLQQPDLTFGNLELTLAGPPYKGYPQFSAPDALAHTLKDVGFDVLVTANNHSLDRGKRGLERTINVLDSLVIQHTGTFKDSLHRASQYPLMIEKSGIKLALLNYTYGTNGIRVSKPNIVNLLDTAIIRRDVERAHQEQPDMIITFVHWGSEYQSQPNPEQKRLADLFFRMGVKLVVGAHPHVLQPVQWQRDKDQLVAYSLGNFVSGQRTRYRDGGAMLYVDVEKIKSDSSDQVRIAEAAYQLEWVHRDSKGNYLITPLPQHEADSVVLPEHAALLNQKQFAEDSRQLFSRFNVDVAELPDTSFTYTVVINEIDSVWAKQELLRFYGFSEQGQRLQSASFDDAHMALSAWRDVVSKIHYKKASVMLNRRRKAIAPTK